MYFKIENAFYCPLKNILENALHTITYLNNIFWNLYV